MKGYIASLLCVACVCGICEMIAPSGKGGGSRYIRFVCTLVALSVIAAPIAGFVTELKNGDLDFLPIDANKDELESEYRDIFYKYISDQSSDGAADLLEGEICEKFDIDPDDIEVIMHISFFDDECTIDGITVSIMGKAVLKDPHAISDFVLEMSNIKCEIIYL